MSKSHTMSALTIERSNAQDGVPRIRNDFSGVRALGPGS